MPHPGWRPLQHLADLNQCTSASFEGGSRKPQTAEVHREPLSVKTSPNTAFIARRRFAWSYRRLVTKAADEGDPNTTGVVIPGPVRDTGLREPLSRGSLVIRGTRPAPLPVAEPPVVRYQPQPPADMRWVPAPYYGSGWDTGYDWGGLSNTPTPYTR